MQVAVLGFGGIAEHGHVPAWLAQDGVTIAAVADVSAQRRERVADLLPAATVYEAPLDVLAHPKIDVLDICTPPSTHAALLMAACEYGIPCVVCEKPFVVSSQAFQAVARAREQSRTRVISVTNWKYSDHHALVTDVLRCGAIGTIERIEVRIARTNAAQGEDAWNPRWRTDAALSGGGILMDHGWHQLYLLLSWIGRPVQWVSATIRTLDDRHAPVEDDVQLEIECTGVRCCLHLSWAADRRETALSLTGSLGTMKVVDGAAWIERAGRKCMLPPLRSASQSSHHPEWFAAFFADTVLSPSSAAADASFAEAGSVMAAIEAAYTSSRLGGKRCSLVALTRTI
jgi:predicted dehydrogenase